MNVKRVPALVVVFRETSYDFSMKELYRGDTNGLRSFMETLASGTVPLLETNEKIENFISNFDQLGLRVLLVTDKDAVASSFSILATQYRGEVDFGCSSFKDDELKPTYTKYMIKEPSVLIFGFGKERRHYLCKNILSYRQNSGLLVITCVFTETGIARVRHIICCMFSQS
jgi:hypothetical protein